MVTNIFGKPILRFMIITFSMNQDQWMKKLLPYFRTHGRISLTTLSKELQTPLATIFQNHKKLEKKVITKYVALLKFSYLGYGLRYYIYVRMKHKQDPVKEVLLNHPCLNSAYAISKHYHLLLDMYFQDFQQYHEFVEEVLEHHTTSYKVIPLVEAVGEELFMEKE